MILPKYRSMILLKFHFLYDIIEISLTLLSGLNLIVYADMKYYFLYDIEISLTLWCLSLYDLSEISLSL